MVRISLKVDVDTLRGTLEGVPALLRLFDTYQIRATFLFSLGPDHTGRALRRVFRPGFLSKVRRTSVASHYGLKTLMYGTLLPGPDIGKRAGDVMRAVAEAGHEVGIHCYDHIKWQDFVAHRDEAWSRLEMERAADAFERVFGRKARVHGAAGWQINPHALALEEQMGFDYASDTRGRCAFYPVLQGVRSRCPQIPTTLPTLDELIGREDITEDNVHEYLFAESQYLLPEGQVYTLHAELEGMKLRPVMERLLVMWRGVQADIHPIADVFRSLDLEKLPCHQVGWGELPGRSGYLALQGAACDSRDG
ncbi:MAG: polysaccharide deacetylase family protein [Pseudomonadota bacterium]|nr:polysaccharide deacetylase family protein [Pseudomonadota bacterium]